MASVNPVKVVQVCQVTPSSDPPESATESSLPLTFLDLFWFKIPPVKRIFFYEAVESTPEHFHSVILPKLKRSLSLVLAHFLPVAGNLVWPPDASKPLVLYSPGNGVSLTVAESSADLGRLSGNHVREAVESHPYIPELAVSDSVASIIALQITLFPNQGFCIGISEHQAVVDVRSTALFVRAWAHTCKNMENEGRQPSLLPELTPFFDRTVIQDPEDIATEYLNNWSALKLSDLGSNPKSLKLLPLAGPPIDKVRTTCELSGEDIEKLRGKVLSLLDKVPEADQNQTKDQLTTFVIAFAYTLVCVLRAKGLETDTKIIFGFPVDCRPRLEPPIPETYFGNCVSIHRIETQAGPFIGADGLVSAAKELGGLMKGLEKGVLEGAKEKLAKFFSGGLVGVEKIGVAGSNQLNVYATDFGWGRPKKVEITSIDGGGSIALAESRDGSGGVELGLVLKKHEMDMFQSLFASGLK